MSGTEISDVIVGRLLKEMEGYLELELHDETIARADRLLAAGRAEEEALKFKGRALQDARRHEEAVEAYEKLRALVPEDESVHLGLGWCHKRTGRLDLAIASLETLVEMEPDNALGVYNLSCYLALDGERDRALDLLRKAIELESGFREHARGESDFDGVRDDPEFVELIGD